MSEEDQNFDKMFSEIINSDDLKDISENFDKKINLNIKELLLMQQSLLDAVSNISDILITINKEGTHDILAPEDECYDILSSLYKISEDFNECMIEYYSNIDIELIEDDEGDIGDAD